MRAGRKVHTATLLLNGDVFVSGGLDDAAPSAVLASDELFTIHDSWKRADELDSPRLLEAAALLLDGRVLITGGQLQDGTTLATTAIFTP